MNNEGYFPIERNRYYYGKLLTVRDFEIEQDYVRNKNRLSNRLLSGAGVVCGLNVTRSDDSTLLINSGMALDYDGREIVVEQPLVRRLQMLEGYESLKGKADAYLCLAYQEEGREPVKAVGAQRSEERQFNVIREGYRLFLTAQAPDYCRVLESMGAENVCVLYSDDQMTVLLSCPAAVCGGEELLLQATIIKKRSTPPIHFVLEGENRFVEDEDGWLRLEYRQSPEENGQILRTTFCLRTQTMHGIRRKLFPAGAELTLTVGSRSYKNLVHPEIELELCRDAAARKEAVCRSDSLQKHLVGSELPIYLAKLELLNSATGVFVDMVTNLPFEQRIRRESSSGGSSRQELTVETQVRSLDYYQKPEVRAAYSAESGKLAFDFGIPTPEQYDYTMSHGVVELEMPGGLRVNARYFSEEIPHGLGAGAVDVRLSVEFTDQEGETALLMGNSEVFKGKNIRISPPWAEAAAVVYPERGTIRIGVWLHDTVLGNRIRVHYFAQKPERDAERLMTRDQVSIRISPEISRLSCQERLQFSAVVEGSTDKTVTWKVKDAGGGSIDRNGLYQAPETPGTYEVCATSNADKETSVSGFVVVE